MKFPKTVLCFLIGLAAVGTLFSMRKNSVFPPVLHAPLQVRGSIPYWDQEKAVQTVFTHPHLFNEASFFWYFLSDSGSVTKYTDAHEDKAIIDSMRVQGTKASAVITNLPQEAGTTWDSERVERALATSSSRAVLVKQVIDTLDRLGFAGVTIDFESIRPTAKENYSVFIKELAQKLHQSDKVVGVALHPKSGEKDDRRYDFQDWRQISIWADELYIMAYGEHYDEGSPGAIASATWVKKVIAYTQKLGVPLAKFYLGIPLYGYDWGNNESKAHGLVYSDVRTLMDTYDISQEWRTGAAPHFDYTTDGEKHEVWFENSASVLEKVKLANDAGFGGVTFWRLGGEDQKIWGQLQTEVGKK